MNTMLVRPSMPRSHRPFFRSRRRCFYRSFFELWANWNETGPEPTVEIEVKYEPYTGPVPDLFKKMVELLGHHVGGDFDYYVIDCGPDAKSRTQGAVARAIIEDI